MQFHVRHESLYRYDVPVQLGEHVLRLSPRPGSVRLVAQHVAIQPEPVSRVTETDAHGNAVLRLAFTGSTREFHVLSELELQTLAPPPLIPSTAQLPLDALSGLAGGGNLGVYLGGPIHPNVASFAAEQAREAGYEPVAFLDRLTRTLFERIERGIRPTGEARPAHETLALNTGACRDLTVLFLDACRSQGLPARFVSGYQAQAQTPDGQRHLHAWAEVAVPNTGWHGWDPMHGLRVGDGHVALCAAPQQAATMPIEGGFYFQGATVNSTLDSSVHIRTV